jgi:DNA recombination protein RmuC
VGKEIGKLQEVLRAPKARGGFGEFLLADLLAQMIPRDHFELQYQFRNGNRVDAVIRVGDYLVPVDAKFPLDNFERYRTVESSDEKVKAQKDFVRDIKKHINEIADRYIVPDEGTLDFALMYVPAENVYYELITSRIDNNDSGLSDYALKHRVVPVSPNSFYAYLQVILMGLRGLRMDKAAREIADLLAKLKGDFERITSDFSVLGSHLSHAQGSYEKIHRNLDRFQDKLHLVDQAKPITTDNELSANSQPSLEESK